MTIKLIAIDMDDTLLRANKTYDEERFREIFTQLRARNITVTIASGNSYPRLDEYFEHMNHDDLYFASDNGNFVVKKGEVLHKSLMDFSDTLAAAELLEDSGYFSVIVCDGLQSYSTGIMPEHAAYILSYYGNLIIVDSLNDINNREIVKVSNHSPLPLSEIKTYTQKISDRFPEFDAVSSGGGWFDFFHIDGGKGSAVKALQKKYGIRPAETMVFGDSLNDASMTEHAKYSVAMANADEELKKISRYEIGSNEEQAVLDILEELLATDSVEFMEKYQKNAK